MKFERCFQYSSLSLILSGFLSILLAGSVSLPGTVIFLSLLLLGWFKKPREIKKIYQWLVTGIILLVFLLDLLLFSRLMLAVIRLMLALILLKVFTRENQRDYSTLYLLSFSLLLIASTSTISALFVISAAAVLLTFVLSLNLFEMREAYQADPRQDFSFRKSVQASLVMAMLIILLAVPIFLVIPRTALGMFGQTSMSAIGFSPNVDLGDMGNMLESGEVVMRVEVKEGRDSVSPDMKWRGVAMDSFNGRTWSNTVGGARQVLPDPQGRYLIQTGRYQNEQLIEQSVYMEPFSSIVFTTHNPIQLSGFNRSQQILQSGNETLYLQPKPNKAVQYTLFSDTQSRTRKLKAFDENAPTAQLSRRYLQLPELDPRIQSLAETVVRDATSKLAEVLLLENFLRVQFEYSLNHNSGSSDDPVGNFLFSTRRGHCEYFATAHVIMLRTLGIPARMINGFRFGEYNEWGDYFIVRQSDAHSWVEAYLPGSGWVEFDPTPARPGDGSFSLARTISKILDNLDILWTEIVTFDRYKQFGFFRVLISRAVTEWQDLSLSARKFAHADFRPLLESLISPFHMGRVGLLFALVLLAGVLLRIRRFAILAFLRKYVLRLDPNEMIRRYYRDMLKILKIKGYPKKPAETPGEFLSRISGAFPSEFPELITDIYVRTRFGGRLAGSFETEEVASALRKISRTGKPGRNKGPGRAETLS